MSRPADGGIRNPPSRGAVCEQRKHGYLTVQGLTGPVARRAWLLDRTGHYPQTRGRAPTMPLSHRSRGIGSAHSSAAIEVTA